MYCKVCGKDLNEKDKFCSNCGTKVTVEAESDKGFTDDKGFISEVVDFEKEECEDKGAANGAFGFARNIDFDWDLGGFPAEKEIDPAKVDFNWSSVVDDRKKVTEKDVEIEGIFSEEDIHRGEPATFDWGLGATTRIDRASLEKDASENVVEAKPVTDISELVSEEGVTEEAEQEKRKIDKFYTFNKKNEEFQALLDQEYERLRQRIHEENEAEEALASKYEKLEKARDTWENTQIEPDGGADLETVEEASEGNADKPSGEVGGTYPALENFFDKPFETADEGVIAIYQPIGTTIVDETVLKECFRKESAAAPKKNKIKYSDIFDFDGSDDEKSNLKKSPEAAEEYYGKKRKGRGGKILLDILIVVLALVVIAASILIFAKDSAPGMYIQKGIDKVTSLFAGEDEPVPPTVPSDVTTAMSAVIDAELVKNKNIGTVREGENLGFAHDSDYGIEGFTNSSAFVDSVWFTDDGGNTVNYGNIIIGNIISYYSQLVDFKNGVNEDVFNLIVPESDFYHTIKDTAPAENHKYAVKVLEFGEIRTIGDNYYALVQTTEAADDGSSEVTGKKIVQLVAADKTMNIVSIRDI